MLSLTVHCVQNLSEWHIRATLVRDLGTGFTPEVTGASMVLPMMPREYEDDDLSAVLSAIARWSGMTSDCNRVHEDD